MRIITLLSLILLAGCPDPNASSSGSETTSDPSANTGTQETDPSAARLTCTKDDADCLEVSGEMAYDGEVKGSIRVDVQKVREGSAPILVHTIELQSDGTFAFYVPNKYGKIIVTAFIDEDGDGPSQKDPQGRSNLDIQDEALTGLTIEVKSDNAPVMPKPPEDAPKDEAKKGTTETPKGTPPAEQKTENDNNDGPPADDNNGPPADE